MCLAKSLVSLLLFSFFLNAHFLLFLMYVFVCEYVGTGTQGGQRVSLLLKLQAAGN